MRHCSYNYESLIFTYVFTRFSRNVTSRWDRTDRRGDSRSRVVIDTERVKNVKIGTYVDKDSDKSRSGRAPLSLLSYILCYCAKKKKIVTKQSPKSLSMWYIYLNFFVKRNRANSLLSGKRKFSTNKRSTTQRPSTFGRFAGNRRRVRKSSPSSSATQ